MGEKYRISVGRLRQGPDCYWCGQTPEQRPIVWSVAVHPDLSDRDVALALVRALWDELGIIAVRIDTINNLTESKS